MNNDVHEMSAIFEKHLSRLYPMVPREQRREMAHAAAVQGLIFVNTDAEENGFKQCSPTLKIFERFVAAVLDEEYEGQMRVVFDSPIKGEAEDHLDDFATESHGALAANKIAVIDLEGKTKHAVAYRKERGGKS